MKLSELCQHAAQQLSNKELEAALSTINMIWVLSPHPRLCLSACALARRLPPVPTTLLKNQRDWLNRAAERNPLELELLVQSLCGPGISDRESILRLEQLEKRYDARLGVYLLNILLQAPFEAKAERRFFEKSCEQIGATQASVLAPKARAVANLAAEKPGTAWRSLKIWLNQAAARLESPAPEPGPELTGLLESLEREFRTELLSITGELKSQERTQDTGHRLWEAILQDPDALEPRLVYADFLSEQGDIRGEFIQLHCQLCQLDVSQVPLWLLQRLSALSHELGPGQLLGALAPAAQSFTLQNGLPHHIVLSSQASGFLHALKQPSWKLIRSISLAAPLYSFNLSGLMPALKDPIFSGIQAFNGLVPSLMLEIPPRPLKWLRSWYSRNEHSAMLQVLEQFAPEKLSIHHNSYNGLDQLWPGLGKIPLELASWVENAASAEKIFQAAEASAIQLLSLTPTPHQRSQEGWDGLKLELSRNSQGELRCLKMLYRPGTFTDQDIRIFAALPPRFSTLCLQEAPLHPSQGFGYRFPPDTNVSYKAREQLSKWINRQRGIETALPEVWKF